MSRAHQFAASACLGLALAALAGCSRQAPQQSDPDQARALLQQVLDGWKKGDSLDAFIQTAHAVTVIDYQWKAGAKLLDYEIGKGEPSGFDIVLTAKLTVQDAGGKKSEKATYTVSTHPKQVVIRTAPGS